MKSRERISPEGTQLLRSLLRSSEKLESRSVHRAYRIHLVLAPQLEGGFTVTSPDIPELLTEGDTLSEALENVKDALAAVVELYQEEGRELPPHLVEEVESERPLHAEHLIAV